MKSLLSVGNFGKHGNLEGTTPKAFTTRSEDERRMPASLSWYVFETFNSSSANKKRSKFFALTSDFQN